MSRLNLGSRPATRRAAPAPRLRRPSPPARSGMVRHQSHAATVAHSRRK